MDQGSRRIEAVLFDLDDTLIDWADVTVSRDEYYRPRVRRLRDFLMDKGYELPPASEFQSILDQAIFATWEEAKKTWIIKSYGAIFSQVLLNMGLIIEGLDIDELLRLFDWNAWPGVVNFPDTIPVLEELRWRGYKIGLLTNSILPMWMRDVELETFQLLTYFDARVTAADVGYVKPHPNIYYALLDMMKITPDRAVFVGDRPKNDIAGANAVGLISVLMDPPHLQRDLNGVIPDHTITALGELLPLLEELEQVGQPGLPGRAS
jgi:putative hydrolase of the HAD superfamily